MYVALGAVAIGLVGLLFVCMVLRRLFPRVADRVGDPLIRREMKRHNVIFAGTVRNVEQYMAKSLADVEACGAKFKDFSLVLYENDSTDRTRDILRELKRPNYHYIFEDNVDIPGRTARLAAGRNKVLQKARELNASGTFTYLIVLDLDDVNSSGRFVNSIESCFARKDWDALAANQSLLYYDLWALRRKNDLMYDVMERLYNTDNPNSTLGNMRHRYSVTGNYPAGKFLEVESAFGGAAIYRLDSIPAHCAYVGTYPDGRDKCEHVDFHGCLRDAGANLFINTSFYTS
jgi:glycosyltransferase involved in cell wall biosynthesis